MRLAYFISLFLIPAISAEAGWIASGMFAGDPETIETSLAADLLQPPGDHADGLSLLVLSEPAPQAWWDDLEAQGLRRHGYIPDHGFIVYVPAHLAARLKSRPNVEHFGPFHPGLKLREDVLAGPFQENSRLIVHRVVRDQRGRSAVQRFEEILPGEAYSDLSTTLAEDQDVLAISLEPLAELANEKAGWVAQGFVENERPLFDRGITGAGEIIAICDTGLSLGCFHEDTTQEVIYERIDPLEPPAFPMVNPYHRKVAAYQYWNGTDTEDEGIYHGTHVAGTASGDHGQQAVFPEAGLDPFDGIAPGSRIVIQDIDLGGGYLEPPPNLSGFIQAAYNAGARVHNDSWAAATSSYASLSYHMDRAMWENPELLVVVAAGNRGPDPGTIGSPGTAKNVIAVGSTYNGKAADRLSTFSARGPSADGRMKPDIVAPGGSVTSADGAAYCDTKTMAGTSMASPVVAAGAALVRSYYRQGFYPTGRRDPESGFVPSGALIKATLLIGATDITAESGQPSGPDNNQGFGRINLEDSLHFEGEARDLLVLVDDDVESGADGFPSGATSPCTYRFEVNDSTQPLRVALAWTDYPAVTGSSAPWVNDLDLLVTDPQGVEYKGNAFQQGFSTPGGGFDRKNNVEQCWFEGPQAKLGIWTVSILPFGINVGPQPFALVVTGGLEFSDRQCSTGPVFEGLQQASDIDACLDDGVALTWSIPERWGCGDERSGHFEILRNGAFLASTRDGTATSYIDETGSAGETYEYSVVAVNEAGPAAGGGSVLLGVNESGTLPDFAGLEGVVDPEPCGHGGLLLWWREPVSWGGPGQGSFTIYRDGKILASGLAPSTVEYTDGTALPDMEHRYAVAAVNACGISNDAGRTAAGRDLAAASSGRLTLGKAGQNAALSWEPTEGYGMYRIYRSTTLPLTMEPATRMGEVWATTWTEPAGGSGRIYYYEVVPICEP